MIPENDADDKRIQQPVQQSMFEGSERSNPSEDKHKPGQATPLTGTHSLSRLRDRIELTVKELTRLRNENAALQKQLQEAQSNQLEGIDGTPVVFSENPAALRAKVESFIGAIDRYVLESERVDAPSDNSDSGA